MAILIIHTTVWLWWLLWWLLSTLLWCYYPPYYCCGYYPGYGYDDYYVNYGRRERPAQCLHALVTIFQQEEVTHGEMLHWLQRQFIRRFQIIFRSTVIFNQCKEDRSRSKYCRCFQILCTCTKQSQEAVKGTSARSNTTYSRDHPLHVRSIKNSNRTYTPSYNNPRMSTRPSYNNSRTIGSEYGGRLNSSSYNRTPSGVVPVTPLRALLQTVVDKGYPPTVG